MRIEPRRPRPDAGAVRPRDSADRSSSKRGRGLVAALALGSAVGCSGDPADAGGALAFPPGFRFGSATSSEQIEGGNLGNDWYQFTHLPEYAALTNGWSGRASDGYARFDEDAGLSADAKLDAYRFTIEWARVMPAPHQFDAAEIEHYRAVIDANLRRGVEPMVTLHHFTNPRWVHDLEHRQDCPDHPSATNLCGWTNPETVQAFAEFCGRMGAEYGARVDLWETMTELNNYLQNAYVAGTFPPGVVGFGDIDGTVIPVARGMLEAHARCYDALHAADTFDADGDGVAASVGTSWATQHLHPGDPSNPDHVQATEDALYVEHRLFMNAMLRGDFDRDFDGTADETHPSWAGRVDWVGANYYSGAAVVPSPLPQPFTALRCSDAIAAGLGPLAFVWLDLLDRLGCPPAPTLDFPLLGYTAPTHRHDGDVHDPHGLTRVLEELHAQYPGLPLYVTENGYGFADGTEAGGGEVRAKSLVRHLAAIHDALDLGIDVRGYFHWSLVDNYEWNGGNRFRIGLYRVDYDTYDRTPTEAVPVYAAIAGSHRISPELLAAYGGDAPLRDGP